MCATPFRTLGCKTGVLKAAASLYYFCKFDYVIDKCTLLCVAPKKLLQMARLFKKNDIEKLRDRSLDLSCNTDETCRKHVPGTEGIPTCPPRKLFIAEDAMKMWQRSLVEGRNMQGSKTSGPKLAPL